jgi:hypothetical protein
MTVVDAMNIYNDFKLSLGRSFAYKIRKRLLEGRQFGDRKYFNA